VQVLEESRDFSSTSRSTPIKNSAEGIGEHSPAMPPELLSRSQFLSYLLAEREAWKTALPKKRKCIIIWLGSTLAITVGSILFLQGRSVVVVPSVWYVASGILLESFILKPRKQLEESSKTSNAHLKKCPFCKGTTRGSSHLIITTGRCRECLNVILQDDLGCCGQKVAH
jgi:hypothetical protein